MWYDTAACQSHVFNFFSVFIFIREFSYRIFIEDAEYVEIDGVVSVAGGAVCA